MNTRRKFLSSLVILCALTFCPDCHGQTRQIHEGQPDFKMSELNTLLGRIARSLGDEVEIKAAMPRLLHWWGERGDLGAAGFDLSNSFLFVMEENPKAFFSSMSAHPKAFAGWLKELPDDSFTWDLPPPCRLEAKRKQLIMILAHTEIHDPKTAALKDAVLARLSAIGCRQIR